MMVISRGESVFEVYISPTDDREWEGRIIEHTIHRLVPTVHLQHSWVTVDMAIAGIARRWQRLFPDEDLPDFRDAVAASPRE